MPMAGVQRIDGANASAADGLPILDFSKTIWFVIFTSAAVAAPFFISSAAILLFIATTYLSLLLGHSVGMHRMLIHKTFSAPRIVTYPLIWFGSMVGMGGPSKIIATHDLRDWAQRQRNCHDFFSHRRGIIRDLTWQLFYRFEFENAPRLNIENAIFRDPFYSHLDKWWPVHQAALISALWIAGGAAFACWVFGVRVFVSVCGHWCVTYICHNPGPGRWRVVSAGVQASNLRGALLGFITHGECWHNNHHAFPESAQIGLERGQIDPAWIIISHLEKLGIARNVGRPRPHSERDDLIELASTR